MKTKPAARPWETGRPKHGADNKIVVSGEAEDNR